MTLDLYGRGFSDNPDVEYTDTLFAHQVLELLDHLGLEKASLFGLSNGGARRQPGGWNGASAGRAP